VLDAAIAALGDVPAGDWTVEQIELAVRSLQDTLDLKLRKFVSVLYVAVMGSPQGIPLFDSIAMLGQERTLHRLEQARSRVDAP
jgi:glutamyl-tRNA synthetase